MGSAIVAAFLWLAISIEVPTSGLIASLPMAASYLLAAVVPVWLRHRHVKAQNRLLDRCRALLLAGSHHLARGDRAGAVRVLIRIRRIECLWRYGDSMVVKVCLALWAVGCGVMLCIVTRSLGFLAHDHIESTQPLTSEHILTQLMVVGAISLFAPLEAITGYTGAWRHPWAIDNCGERLWQMIYGPRAVAAFDGPQDESLGIDGLSPRELFGLGPTFTRRELERARRRLAWDLHPDRHRGASPHERKARDDAMKRVNAAFDLLMRDAI